MSRSAGYEGEAAAARFLQARGFEILARNYTIRGAEIDLIVREGDFIAFVEVKSRGNNASIAPRERVNMAKQRRMGQAALRWLQENGMSEANVRFDVVEVTPQGVVLLRGAFSYRE